MTKMQHTPGPWYWEGSYDHEQYNIYAAGSDWMHIATVNNLPRGRLQLRDPSRSKANTRLIAQAPAMLAALRDLVADCKEHGHTPRSLRHARAILARIDGGA